MIDTEDDIYAPLESFARDPERRLELLDPKNVALANRMQTREPMRYAKFLGLLDGWDNRGFFKQQISRRRAFVARVGKAEKENAEAMERLNKAELEGHPTISEARPTRIARDFRTQVMPHLAFFNGECFEHKVNAYRPIEQAVVRAELADWMEGAVNDQTGMPVLVNKRVLDDVMDSLKSQCVVASVNVSPPIWLEPMPGDPEPTNLIACRNGLVNVTNGALLPNTPRLFNLVGLPYEYEDPFFVLPPYTWLNFLESLWPEAEGGASSKALLQEWCGLMLTTDTRYQKILLLLGPGRSGKGTIVRLLTDLIGAANVADTSLNQLGREFGRQALIGKSMMVVSDMRLGRATDVGAVSESLLNLSGEDRRSVPRKFLPDWEGGLHARIMLVGNLKLILPDQSGALAMRYLPLVLNKSFVGREDLNLGEKLRAELPAILLWALAGLRRLRARGHFVQTEAGKTVLQDIRKHASPLKMFMAERCLLGEDLSVEKEVLFDAYEDWTADENVRDTHDMATFARDLFAASNDAISVSRPRLPDGSRPRIFTGIALRPEFADY